MLSYEINDDQRVAARNVLPVCEPRVRSGSDRSRTTDLRFGSIPSTGGITYFVFSATVPDCDWIQADPVERSERDFSVFMAEMRGEFCPFCIDCYHQETSALVLGNLPAGDYQLSTYGPSPFAGGKRLLWTQPFSVPSDSGPTLIATLDGEAVRIDVRGVPAAHYVIEASATLQDWRPVYTALGAPFAWTTNRTSEIGRAHV